METNAFVGKSTLSMELLLSVIIGAQETKDKYVEVQKQ